MSGHGHADGWKKLADEHMSRYADGDPRAFAHLYDLIAPRLHAFLARRTCGDAARAEDLLQQTFLQIHASRQHFFRGADVMPWAFAIARRLLIDSARAKREVLPGDDDMDDVHGSSAHAPDLALESRQLAEGFARALARIPEPQRAAFELTRYDGLSVEEAARALGTTKAAVKLRVHRTYEALRDVAAGQRDQYDRPRWPAPPPRSPHSSRSTTRRCGGTCASSSIGCLASSRATRSSMTASTSSSTCSAAIAA